MAVLCGCLVCMACCIFVYLLRLVPGVGFVRALLAVDVVVLGRGVHAYACSLGCHFAVPMTLWLLSRIVAFWLSNVTQPFSDANA